MGEQILTILYVQDLGRSKDFYSVFNWRQTVDVPTYVEYALSETARLGLMLRTSTPQFLGTHANSLATPESVKCELYLTVSDVDEAARLLESRGATCTSSLEMRGWGDIAAYYLDPDGHVVAVASLSRHDRDHNNSA